MPDSPFDDPEVMNLSEELSQAQDDVISNRFSNDPEVMDLSVELGELGAERTLTPQQQRSQENDLLLTQVDPKDPELVEQESMWKKFTDLYMGMGELAVYNAKEDLVGGAEIVKRSAQGGLALAAGVVEGTVAAIETDLHNAFRLKEGEQAGSKVAAFTSEMDRATKFFLNEIPNTQVAKNFEKALDTWIAAPLEHASRAVGDPIFQATKSPALAAAGATAVQALPIALSYFVPGLATAARKRIQARKAGDETSPVSAQEKELLVEAGDTNQLTDRDPIKDNDIQIVEMLDNGTELQANLEQNLKTATNATEQNAILTQLEIITKENLALSGQLSKNKVKELEELAGLPITRPTNNMPQFEITAPDKRTSAHMKKEMFEVHTVLHSDGTPQAVFKQKYPDLTPEQVGLGKVTTAFATAEKHPLAKWTRDKMKAHVNRANNLADALLNAPMFETGFGITALRQARKKSTDAGALTIFARSSLNDQVKMLDTMLEFDHLEKLPSRTTLVDKGFTPEQISSVYTIRTALDTTRTIVNQSIIKYGPEGADLMANIPGYLPHVWKGDFRVWIRDTEGKLVDVLPANSRGAAKNLTTKLKDHNEELQITFGPKSKASGSDADVQNFASAMSYMQRGNTPSAKSIRTIFEKNLGTAGFGKHMKERAGVGGFAGSKVDVPGFTQRDSKRTRDFMDGLTTYVSGGIKYAENLRAKKEFGNVFTDKTFTEAYPQTLRWGKAYLDESFGVRKGLGKLGEGGLVEKWFGQSGLDRAFQNISHGTSIALLFAGNAKFLAMQGIQPYQMMGGALRQQKALGTQGSTVQAIVEGHRAFFKPDADEVDAIRYSIDNGSISPKFVDEAMGTDFFKNGILTKGQKWFEVLSGRAAAGKMEVWARTLENLVFYRQQRNAGRSHQESMERASEMTNKHMIEYNHREVSLALGRSSPLGPVAIPAKLFKSFTLNQFAQMGSFIRTAKQTHDLTPVAAYIGSQALVGGAIGMFAIKEVDALLELLGQPTLTDMMLQSGQEDALIYGPLSSETGTDFSSSMSAGSILPKSILTLPGLEWAGKIGASIFKWSKKALNAGGSLVTPMDTMLVMKSFAPKSFHGFIEEYYTDPHPGSPVPLPAFGGRGFFVRDDQDKLKRFFSTRSMAEKRIMDSLWSLTRQNRKDKVTKDNLVQFLAHSVMKLNSVPQFAIDMMIKLEMTGKSTSSAVRNLIEAQTNTAAQNAIQSGKTRKGRANYLKLKEMGNRIYHD